MRTWTISSVLTVNHNQLILCCKKFYMHLRDAIRRQFPSMFYDVIGIVYVQKRYCYFFLKCLKINESANVLLCVVSLFLWKFNRTLKKLSF